MPSIATYNSFEVLHGREQLRAKLYDLRVTRGLRAVEIAKELNTNTALVKRYLERYALPLPPPTRLVDMAGQQYGFLTVESYVLGPSRNGAKWSCRCACGARTTVARGNLLSGSVTSCGCMRAVRRSGVRGERQGHWKPVGHRRNQKGYALVKCPEHPNAQSRGWVLEHIKVMADRIGRPIRKFETVHHKNGVKDDNRPENLELWATSHPYGQRVEDKIAWCVEFLQTYAPEKLAAPAKTADA